MTTTIQDIKQAFQNEQKSITSYLQEQGAKAYLTDKWDYKNGNGGGITQIWDNSGFIEKGGVNFSFIEGEQLPPTALQTFNITNPSSFIATGISIVIHPLNPFVPTIHLNVRYFESGDLWWFGGGIDLTPIYPIKSQIIYFHQQLQTFCTQHQQDYQKLKTKCDEYFFLKHRNETRGVGGLFFDRLSNDKSKNFKFVVDLADSFVNLYTPFISQNKDLNYTEEQKEFQLYRRSRYVEFNLLYDRGTHFGLQSNGRTESIMMSMPPTVKWRYNWQAPQGSPEAELVNFYLKPRDWI